MVDQNKRKFPRANYPCSLTIWQENNFETILADTVNIGAGGFLVYLNQRLTVGAKAEVKIDFFKGMSLKCFGSVLRCEENEKKLYAVVIVFEGLSESQIATLQGLVAKLMDLQNKKNH
ncbi:MAG: PilZ domain-containing protein [Candidatus Omnitrophica bacterium]|nr:PilZ domain-containing protein [Candidatus Omnitrophota bacterium]